MVLFPLLFRFELGACAQVKHDTIAGGAQTALRLARQVAAVPVRRAQTGEAEVLLVTSRDTGRWVPPKGGLIKRLGEPGTAALEAWEEAGVRGTLRPEPLGVYDYPKRSKKGRVTMARVAVYLLEVAEEHADWPERPERVRRWMSPAEAAASVVEPELAAILAAVD